MRDLVVKAGMALALVLLIPAIPDAGAACFPARAFGQYPTPQAGYFYVIPTGTNTQESIVGRFWEVGARASDNEGDCGDENWVVVCNAPYACRGNPGVTRYLIGYMNGHTERGDCKNAGCPGGGDLAVLVQDTNATGGAEFFFARVGFEPAPLNQYDFSRLERDLTYATIPAPVSVGSSRVGSHIVLDLTLPAVNNGFYGLTGQVAEGPGNLSGYRLFTFTGSADPGRNRGAWVADAWSHPYTGSAVAVSGFSVDCSNTALDVFVAVGLEFDEGSVTTDYVSQALRVECEPAKPASSRSLLKK